MTHVDPTTALSHSARESPADIRRLGGISVLYNQNLRDSPIGEAMAEYADEIEWVVLDNSEIPNEGSAHYAELIGVTYVWMGGNRGLPAAFNRGVQQLRGSVAAVAIFDQDTRGIQAYLKHLLANLQTYDEDVLMPLVRAGSVILSPSRVVGPWHRSMARPGQLPKRFSCINSGMVVKTKLLERVTFDERLFLDFVDHRFVEDARSAGATFRPLWECQLSQDYSRQSDSKDAALRRWRIFSRDIRVFYERRRLGGVFARALLTWRVIRSSIKYRTLDFLHRRSESPRPTP